MDAPKISVIMPVLNDEVYLADAIDSILCQTLPDFEFIIISEFGNNDSSTNILKRYAESDSRIRLIQNESNMNISASLNIGIDMARGKYIARMDADDISLPKRFAVQTAFLDSNPDISICASAISTIDEHGHILNRIDQNSNDSDQIQSDLLFYCCIQHPTVMIRRSDLSASGLRYNNDYSATEDYELWNRVTQNLKIIRLPEPLLLYRLHPTNSSRVRKEQCFVNYINVMRDNFLRFDMRFTDEQLRILCPLTCEITFGNFIKYCGFIDMVAHEMIKKNQTLNLYDPKSLHITLRRRAYWHNAPWRFGVALTARLAASIIQPFFDKAALKLKSVATCAENFGIRALRRIIVEYMKERLG